MRRGLADARQQPGPQQANHAIRPGGQAVSPQLMRWGRRRVRSQVAAKEAGNTAFQAGRWQDAFQSYSTALEADTDLRTPFIAQCASNRYCLAYTACPFAIAETWD